MTKSFFSSTDAYTFTFNEEPTALIFASVTGFSRIYLSQHFLADVLFGSLIGMISTVITYVIVYYKERKNINLIKIGIDKLGRVDDR